MNKWTDRVEFLKETVTSQPHLKAFTISRRNLEVLIKAAEKSVEDQRNWETIKHRHDMEVYALHQKLKATEAKIKYFQEKAGVRK